MYIEMAGGDIENAISLYFSMSEGGGGGDFPMNDASPPAPPPSASSSPALSALFGTSSSPLPESWTDQSLTFNDQSCNFPLGLKQLRNGPCGALAAINALMISHVVEDRRGKECPHPLQAPNFQCTVSDDDLFIVVDSILGRCASEGDDKLWIKWKVSSSIEEGYTVEKFGNGQNTEFVEDVIEGLKSKGGLLQLLLSAIETHTVDKVKVEAAESDNGQFQPLISGPFHLCGTEIINLLLNGNARGTYSNRKTQKVQSFQSYNIA